MESTNRTDRLLHENVEAFAAALAAGKEKVVTPEWPQSCLGVLDGSNQDATCLALLAAIATGLGSKPLLTTGVIPSADEEQALEAGLKALAEQGVTAEGVLSDAHESHDRILAVIDKRAAGMCMLPSPFSHDLDELGGTTLGTVVEVCLARSAVPVLVVRGPTDPAPILARPHVVVADADSTAAHATRLGLGLLARDGGPEGTLTITFVYGGQPDPDVDAAVGRGYGATPDELIPLLSHGLSSFLHRLMLLAEASPGLRLETRLIHPRGQLIDQESERDRLHVLPMKPEQHGVSELVHEFVLSTLDPVLVVPRA